MACQSNPSTPVTQKGCDLPANVGAVCKLVPRRAVLALTDWQKCHEGSKIVLGHVLYLLINEGLLQHTIVSGLGHILLPNQEEVEFERPFSLFIYPASFSILRNHTK